MEMVDTRRDRMQQQLERTVRAACQAGDFQAAATALLEEIGPKVLAFLLERLRNPGDASEAFSMFSEDLWKGLPGFEWRCTVRGWSFALARHAADRLRAQAWQGKRRAPLSEAPLSKLVDAVRERTLPHLQTEAKQRLRQMFEQLAPDERALLQLRLDQRLSWSDVALALDYAGSVPSSEQLERSAAKLRQRYKVIKQRLRQQVRELGAGEEDG